MDRGSLRLITTGAGYNRMQSGRVKVTANLKARARNASAENMRSKPIEVAPMHHQEPKALINMVGGTGIEPVTPRV